MAEKQLVVAVANTAAMGPYWGTILTDYLEKLIRCFGGNDSAGQKPSNSNVEFALVTFNTHGCYPGCLVRRTGWTRDPDVFLMWLSAIPFVDGDFSDAAIAEVLSEALMLFPSSQNGSQNQQNVDLEKHCILVAASNAYPLRTPVYVPRLQNIEQSETIDSDAGNHLYDAEAVAKAFPQCAVSLSVICPKQLPELRAIYNAGNRNSGAANPPLDNKISHFHVLISESFREARSALGHSGITSLPANQSPVKVDAVSVASVIGTAPTSVPSANGSITNRQPISAGNMAPATVKVEPVPVTSMVSGPTFPHIPSVPCLTSQGVPSLQTSSPSSVSQDIMASNENAQDVKPMMSMSQPLRPVGPPQANVIILNNLSQARKVLSGGTTMGLKSMGQTPVAMHLSNMISSGMASSVPAAQNVFSSEQSGITSITSSGSLTGPVQVGQNPGLGSLTAATSTMSGSSNIGISQPMGNLQSSVSMGQPGLVMSQGNISGAQIVQSVVNNMNQNAMSGLGPSAVSSGNIIMIPTPGMSQQVQTAANMPLPQQTSGALESTQSKSVKVWEGSLFWKRQGQPVFVTRLEGYRCRLASKSIASNWPQTMEIVDLISRDHFVHKLYTGKEDVLSFEALNPHGLFGELQERKMCAVIQLPSHTLLLAASKMAHSLTGMLFPRGKVIFVPNVRRHMKSWKSFLPQLEQEQPQQVPPHMQQLQEQQPQQQHSLVHQQISQLLEELPPLDQFLQMLRQLPQQQQQRPQQLFP